MVPRGCAKAVMGLRHRRRALGQHWLRDQRYLVRIARAADFSPQDTVIEVGPGTGNLTRLLLARATRLVAVEVDEALAASLGGRFPRATNLTVVAADVLSLPPAELLARADAAPPYVVVGNLPYAIGTAVLRHFLRDEVRPRWLLVMLQEEVARSIVAAAGGMTYLSVEMQCLAEPRLLFTVPPRAFSPPPQVRSAVLRLEARGSPLLPEGELDAFLRFVQGGFAAPRKQLRNSLALGLRLPPARAEALLLAAGLQPARRPGELTLHEWLRLYRAAAAQGLV